MFTSFTRKLVVVFVVGRDYGRVCLWKKIRFSAAVLLGGLAHMYDIKLQRHVSRALLHTAVIKRS